MKGNFRWDEKKFRLEEDPFLKVKRKINLIWSLFNHSEEGRLESIRLET